VRGALAGLAAAVALTGAGSAGDAGFGDWRLDPARTAGSSAQTYTCYVERLDDLGNGKFRETSTRVRADGSVIRQETVSAFDGGDRANGLGDGQTTAFTRIDDRRYAMVFKDHGKGLGTAMRTISGDGGTMTHVGNGTLKGKPFRETLVFAHEEADCEAAKP
jgi:hypothetical protein